MKLLSILIITLASSYSLAGHHTEALWQAHGGSNVVNAGYTYSSITNQLKDSPTDKKTNNVNRLNLAYERGLNDMFSIGAGLDYISESSGADSDGSGFDGAGVEHINVTFKGNHTLGFGGLYYGLRANIGLGNNSTDADGSNNGSLGRTDIIPHVALVMGDRKMGYGLKVDYNIHLTETSEVEDALGVTTETELDGGNALNIALFFEKTLNDKSQFGIGLNYEMTEFNTEEIANVDVDNGIENNIFSVDLYGAITCGCSTGGMSFLPKFSYFMGTGETDNGSDTKTTGGSYAIEMALRKEF